MLAETLATETATVQTDTETDIEKDVTVTENVKSHTIDDNKSKETGSRTAPAILQIATCAIMALFITWLLMTLRKALKTLFKH